MEKKYTIFAGINGSGKSTMYLARAAENLGVRINPDEIAREIGDWRDNRVQMDAARKAVGMVKNCLEEGVSFNQETTLAGKSIFRTMEKARQLGYRIDMYYCGLRDAGLAKDRVKERVQKGGHGIEDGLIEKRYQESINNLKQAIRTCDKLLICDNTRIFTNVAKFTQGILLFNKPCSWLDQIILEYRHEQRQRTVDAIKESGHRPTDRLVDCMEQVNQTSRKEHSVQEIKTLYRNRRSLEPGRQKAVEDAKTAFCEEEAENPHPKNNPHPHTPEQ